MRIGKTRIRQISIRSDARNCQDGGVASRRASRGERLASLGLVRQACFMLQQKASRSELNGCKTPEELHERSRLMDPCRDLRPTGKAAARGAAVLGEHHRSKGCSVINIPSTRMA